VKKTSRAATAALVAAALVALAGCAGTSGGDAASSKGGGTACVILPDSASSPRWESGDRPALQKAITAAGFTADIQNAQGDTAKYATIGDQLLTQGCAVMLLVDYQGAAVGVTKKAKAQGVPVIAYDRPITGADYYVSFDNERIGEMQGQAIVDALKAEGKDPATSIVVYMGGDPTDGNAAMYRSGADKIMSAAGIKPAAEPPGVWDQSKSATNFEQALTSLGGKVDAVWSANDTNAAGIISVLDKNSLKVPVTGQDGVVAGLQNVLLGKQVVTVWKPYGREADAASKLAIELLKGKHPSVSKKLNGVPYIAVAPVPVTQKNVEDVVTGGDATAAEICSTPELQAACATYGVK
jgi:D-xylose transport system substrate-binding protein